jgi:RNA polymerase sigma factor (sigma-70 family)
MRAETDRPTSFFRHVEPHLTQLYNFARRELAYQHAIGGLLPGEMTAEDAVDQAVLSAFREYGQGPHGDDLKGQLLRSVLETIEREVRRSTARRRRMVAVEQDIPETPPEEEVSTLGDEILDSYQPDEDLKLEDVVPDPDVPTPEQILEERDRQAYIHRTLAGLPRARRLAFVLHDVECLSVAEIARITGRREADIERDVKQARELLRERLRESGIVSTPSSSRGRIALFRSARNVGVPAAFKRELQRRFTRRAASGLDSSRNRADSNA